MENVWKWIKKKWLLVATIIIAIEVILFATGVSLVVPINFSKSTQATIEITETNETCVAIVGKYGTEMLCKEEQ